MEVYLDNSSTTRPYDEVIESMGEIQNTYYGNPSSAHTKGEQAEKILKKASGYISESLSAPSDNFVFTSGGTEANNMALLQPLLRNRKRKNHIIISSVEHPAVRGPAEYLESLDYDVTRLNVDKYGLIDIDHLKKSIREETALISVMHVNNEIGTIQPLEDLCKVKAKAMEWNQDLILHSDAVQSFGKIKLNLDSHLLQAIDLMTFSAHKIHGPKGVGALYMKNPKKINPFIIGGGQQKGLRSGTENVSGIAGFGCASNIQNKDMKSRVEKMSDLRHKLLTGIKSEIPDVYFNSIEESSINGETGKCIPSILSVSFLGTKGEVIVHALEEQGVYVSTEAACSSKKKAESPVLKAMGFDSRQIEGTIRFSLGAFNTEKEIEYALDKTKQAVAKFRKLTGRLSRK